MGHVSIPPAADISIHAALTQNVHGAGAYDILDSNDLTGYSKINADSYTGNGSDNRAIPHGLGITPKFVMCTYSGGTVIGALIKGTQWNRCDLALQVTVTGADATNFYVSTTAIAMNTNTVVYYWVALA